MPIIDDKLLQILEDINEASQKMCPEACCGKPVTECKCGPECEHCNCYEENKKSKSVSEGLADMADLAERDHEVQMARAELYKIGKYAIKLHDMVKGISEEEGIEGWMQSKITKAADYISSVYHALDYDMVSNNETLDEAISIFMEGPCDIATTDEISQMSADEHARYAKWKADCEEEERMQRRKGRKSKQDDAEVKRFVDKFGEAGEEDTMYVPDEDQYGDFKGNRIHVEQADSLAPFNYVATVEDYDYADDTGPNSPHGTGNTPQEAADDLLEELIDFELEKYIYNTRVESQDLDENPKSSSWLRKPKSQGAKAAAIGARRDPDQADVKAQRGKRSSQNLPDHYDDAPKSQSRSWKDYRSKQYKESKPDYIDLDGDGNKKEPMKKAAQDAKKTKTKKKSNEGAAAKIAGQLATSAIKGIGNKMVQNKLAKGKKSAQKAADQAKGKDPMPKLSKPGGNETPHPMRGKLVGEADDLGNIRKLAGLK